MKSKCDVLLFGTMGDIGRTVYDDLCGHGVAAVLVEFPQNTFRDEPGYRRELRRALQQWEPTMIIPIGSQLAMARFAKDLPADIIVPVESPEKIRLLESKVDTSALATQLGIPQPEIYTDPMALADADFPVIFKRDKSFGGSGVYRPRNRQALLKLMEHEPGSRFLIEQCVDGYDCSVDAFRWHDSFTAGCYRSLANRGQGPATKRESVEMPLLCDIARRIMDYLDYNGICGMDFRITQSAEPLLLECNPRFTGGLSTQIASGLDLPYMLYGAASSLTKPKVEVPYSVK